MYPTVTILVLDNPGHPISLGLTPYLEKTAKGCRVRMVSVKEGTGAVNQAFREHPNDDIILTSSGVEIETPDWLARLQSRAWREPNCGIVGAKCLDSRGLIYSCGRRIVSRLGLHEHLANVGHGESDSCDFQGYTETDSVLPWLAYIRREAINATGGFDERYMAVPPGPQRPPWLESDDFCLTVRSRGFSVGVELAVQAKRSDTGVHGKYEILYQQARVELLDPIDSRAANLWRKKWHWHPGHPDLDAVRKHWLETPVCWRIGRALLDPLEPSEPMVDLLLVTRNNAKRLEATLASLARTDYPKMRLHVLLNGSTDASKDWIDQICPNFPMPLHMIETPVNLGYVPALNWLLNKSDSPLVARVDDDITVEPDWLARLVERLRLHPYAAAVGAKIVDAEDPKTIQWASYRHWPRAETHAGERDEGQFDGLSRTIANMGCCLLFRRQAMKRAGLPDIGLNPVSWEDLDQQVALWAAGYDVLFDGDVVVRHPRKPHRDHCRRALTHTLGNGYKMAIKWGPGALQAIDEGLDEAGRKVAV